MSAKTDLGRLATVIHGIGLLVAYVSVIRFISATMSLGVDFVVMTHFGIIGGGSYGLAWCVSWIIRGFADDT